MLTNPPFLMICEIFENLHLKLCYRHNYQP